MLDYKRIFVKKNLVFRRVLVKNNVMPDIALFKTHICNNDFYVMYDDNIKRYIILKKDNDGTFYRYFNKEFKKFKDVDHFLTQIVKEFENAS